MSAPTMEVADASLEEPIGPVVRARRFPVSSLVSLQMILLVALPASIDPVGADLGFVVAVTIATIGATLVGEMLTSARRSSNVPLCRVPDPGTGATVITMLACIGFLAGAASGLGEFDSGIARAEGGIQSLARLLQYLQWPAVALCVLGLVDKTHPRYTRRRSYTLLLFLILSTLVYSLAAALLVPSITQAFTIAALGFILRVWRPTQFIVVGLLALTALPAAYSIRNEYRVSTDSNFTALTLQDRLRQDLLLSQAATAVPREYLGFPGATIVARAAVLPRPLDPNRPLLDYGQRLSLAAGRSGLSSNTFTQPGNVLYFTGWVGLCTFYTAVGAIAGGLSRRLGPILTTSLSVVLANLVFIGGSFPSSVAAVGQALLISVPLLLLVRAIARTKQTRQVTKTSRATTS